MTLPAFDYTPEGVEGKAYATPDYCSVLNCPGRRHHRHHIVRRTATGKPFNWVRLRDGTIVGNIVGLCVEHHDDVTVQRNALRYEDEAFYWCKVQADGHGGLTYIKLSALVIQPPVGGEEIVIEDDHVHEITPDGICPTCGHRTSTSTAPTGEKRRRKTWTVKVPDDTEDGATVLDTLIDDLAPLLGYESVPNTRYYTLVRVLAFAQVSKGDLIADMDLAGRSP